MKEIAEDTISMPKQDSTAVEAKKKQEENAYLDKVRGTNMVVSALIATVTFAAGFTMPGGFIQEHDQPDKGSPILRYNPAFQGFVITDTISFVLSASAVLFQIFSSLEDNRYMSKRFLVVALILTMLAMVFMIIAFGTGIYAVLAASKALAVVTLLIALSFYFTFLLYRWIVFKYDSKEEEEQEEEGVSIFPKPDGPILKAEDIQVQLSESHT